MRRRECKRATAVNGPLSDRGLASHGREGARNVQNRQGFRAERAVTKIQAADELKRRSLSGRDRPIATKGAARGDLSNILATSARRLERRWRYSPPQTIKATSIGKSAWLLVRRLHGPDTDDEVPRARPATEQPDVGLRQPVLVDLRLATPRARRRLRVVVVVHGRSRPMLRLVRAISKGI